ncbi:MAG: PD-(D/E)XK nuclease family protein [Candidatus Niyogibacteria bacterium]|nr:PD-(D/E)XK nuclease family protein [Candidatus Niyogibacteria bacterium]
MRTSYSALDTYKTCPLKYKYQNIDKLKAPKSKEAVFGTIVHEALRCMFQKTPLYPTLDEVINFFITRWEEKKIKIAWQTGEEEAYYKDGLELLKQFYAKNQPWNFHVVDLESRFDVELADPETGEKHVLAGIIDRIDKIDDHTYEIIDYKTARKMPSQNILDHNLQMSIYHLGLLRRWPHLEAKNIKLSLYFLKHNEKISTERDADSLEKTKASIISTINEIEERVKDQDFPAIPGPLCDWCGYKEVCPMWQHLYKKDALGEEEIRGIANEYLALKKASEENSAQIKTLQGIIHAYLNQNGVERVFGNNGYITRTVKRHAIYDVEKIRPMLEAAGKWADALKVDDRKLEEVVNSLPSPLRQKIQTEALNGEKETKTLTVSRKTIKTETI